jgi:hypothetical protein
VKAEKTIKNPLQLLVHPSQTIGKSSIPTRISESEVGRWDRGCRQWNQKEPRPGRWYTCINTTLKKLRQEDHKV